MSEERIRAWLYRHGDEHPDFAEAVWGLMRAGEEGNVAANKFMVGSRGDMIVVGMAGRTALMERKEAIEHAAWLLAVAGASAPEARLALDQVLASGDPGTLDVKSGPQRPASSDPRIADHERRLKALEKGSRINAIAAAQAASRAKILEIGAKTRAVHVGAREAAVEAAKTVDEMHALADLLLLVGVDDVGVATVARWTPAQREEVRLWASASYLAASDNDVEVPARPSLLPAVEWVAPGDPNELVGGDAPKGE